MNEIITLRNLLDTIQYSKDEKEISRCEDLLKKAIPAIESWLTSQRLDGGDYDNKSFKNLSNQASRLRQQIRKTGINLNHNLKTAPNYGIYGRLMLYKDNDLCISYCVGQSFNEEYITLMQCLTSKKQN